MCLYVCVYLWSVCMYVCTYVCMHVCMYVCEHVCICVCMSVCIHDLFLCMHDLCVHMYICMYVCMHDLCVCWYVCLYVCMPVCMYDLYVFMICMYVRLYMWMYVYTCMYLSLNSNRILTSHSHSDGRWKQLSEPLHLSILEHSLRQSQACAHAQSEFVIQVRVTAHSSSPLSACRLVQPSMKIDHTRVDYAYMRRVSMHGAGPSWFSFHFPLEPRRVYCYWFPACTRHVLETETASSHLREICAYHIYIYIYIYGNVCMYVCIYIHMYMMYHIMDAIHLQKWPCMLNWQNACACVCSFVCVCACVYVCACVVYVHVCMYVHVCVCTHNDMDAYWHV
jgi:hypothetical protein